MRIKHDTTVMTLMDNHRRTMRRLSLAQYKAPAARLGLAAVCVGVAYVVIFHGLPFLGSMLSSLVTQ